ncbi:galactose-1-phosphate uridylyltransferase [Candidatus Hydrogenedentota bacterium]
MPQLRKDPVQERWVIISTQRSKRPNDFALATVDSDKASFCPFCPGSEDTTPSEILALRDDNGQWWTRVVPNNLPTLKVEGDLNSQAAGMYDRMDGIGAHEVIIESPDHDASLASMPLEQVESTIFAYRDRINDLKRDFRLQYILIFRNKGEAAGNHMISHPHSQLIALPVVPQRVEDEIKGSQRYFDFKDRCIFCDVIRQELATHSRVVSENRHFIVFTPFASRFPFETWIVPKEHDSHFHTINDEQVRRLSRILKTTMQQLSVTLNDPPYNMVLHTAPCQEGPMKAYHWHMEIMPRITTTAGFEWGSGFYINDTTPEDAASYLRDAEIQN